MKAATKNGGDGRDGGSTAFSPSAEWLATFQAHYTPELVEAARRYARGQARKVALVRHVDAGYVDDLVQDIIGDTLFGGIAWDPDRVSLKKHVFDAIKSRTRHDYVHSARFHAVRLDVVAESELTDNAEDDVRAANEWSAEVLNALRLLAAKDDELLLLLNAYAQLVTKKLDIMKLTGLTHKRYEAARARLRQLTKYLPAHLIPRTRR